MNWRALADDLEAKQERMMEKTAGEFVKDLAAAQAEMGNAVFNKVNPHFKSKYADLAAVRGAILPALNKHGFAIIQTTTVVDGQIYLSTELAHRSGENRLSIYPIPSGTPQQQGSALTYARRYALATIAGVASDEDDDGNAAEKTKSSAQAKRDGDWETWTAQINSAKSVSTLKDIGDQINKANLPDAWREPLADVYQLRMDQLKAAHPLSNTSQLRQQLKDSLKVDGA